jgi:hypothetical protein
MINWAGDESCKRCRRPLSYAPSKPTGGKTRPRFGRLLTGLVVLMSLAGTYQLGLPDYLRAPRWRHFSLPPGNFSVMMPSDPDVMTLPLVAEGEIPWNRVSAHLWGKEACFVNYADFAFSPEVTDDELSKMARNMAASSNSVVLSERSVGLGGHRGLELEMKPPDKVLPDGRAYSRIYVIGPRVYALLLVGRERGRLVQERNKFFDSFALLPQTGRAGDSERTPGATE